MESINEYFIFKKKKLKKNKNVRKRKIDEIESSEVEKDNNIIKYSNEILKLCKTDNCSFLNPKCEYIIKYEGI